MHLELRPTWHYPDDGAHDAMAVSSGSAAVSPLALRGPYAAKPWWYRGVTVKSAKSAKDLLRRDCRHVTARARRCIARLHACHFENSIESDFENILEHALNDTVKCML